MKEEIKYPEPTILETRDYGNGIYRLKGMSEGKTFSVALIYDPIEDDYTFFYEDGYNIPTDPDFEYKISCML